MLIEKFLSLLAVAPGNCEKNFLGLETWYHYLPGSDFSGCDIRHFTLSGGSSEVPLILLAIIDDLLRVAGLVALGFIIAGAFKFVTSEGNSDKAANARSTIINALAGLAISVTAIVFVNFLGNQLGNK